MEDIKTITRNESLVRHTRGLRDYKECVKQYFERKVENGN